jgi:hypothetical protein
MTAAHTPVMNSENWKSRVNSDYREIWPSAHNFAALKSHDVIKIKQAKHIYPDY